MKTYLCVCLGAALLSLFFTPIVMRVASRARVLDLPGVRKVHQRAIPRVGGVAIALAVLCMAVPVFLLHNKIGEDFREIQSGVVVMLAMGLFVFFLGLLDDIRGLRARTKLLGQVLAAAVVCGVGIRIDSITVADWFVVDFGISSWLVTIIWIVGITNAVNQIDGLDEMAVGHSAIACGVIAV